MKRPENLKQIWTERDLAEHLDLPLTKKGRCRQLGYWVRGGLKTVEKSGRRYFFEDDVIDYLCKRRNKDDGEYYA